MVVNTKESKIVFSAVDRVSSVVSGMAKGITPLQKKLDSIGRGLKDFGTSSMTKGLVGLTGIALGIAKPAMQFEKSMAQVYKTFDPARIGISEKSFSKTVMNMSTGLGIMANDMADIFENMPLPEILNIEGMSDKSKYKGILDMAKTVGMAVTTMSLEAGDAGEKMKTMFNVLGGKDINKVIQTMNAVNEMGNQFGVTPANTLEFLTRQGALGLGSTAKLTNLDTTAIGGTMLSLGATPETAKTSFQKMINVGQAYTSATKKQVEAFKKLGTSAKQFAENWQKAPTDAIIDILNKAKNLKDIEVTPVFKELFGVEGSANIKTLMQNTDNLIKKLKLVYNENAIKDSVLKEFQKLSLTSSFAVDRLKSSFNNMGIILGNALLPHITKLSNYTSKLLGQYDSLDQSTKDLIGSSLLWTTGSLALGVAIGGVSYAVGGLITGISTLGRVYGALSLIGMKPFSLMGKGISGVSNKIKSIPKFKRTPQNYPFANDNGMMPANDNARTLTKFGKLTELMNKIGNASGIAKVMGLLTALEIGGFAVGVISFGAFAVALGAIAVVGVGVYARLDKISEKLKEMGNLFSVLFGGEKSVNGIKKVGWAISTYVGDALVGLLKFINKAIEGFILMKNIVSGMNFDEASNYTNYQLDKINKDTVSNIDKTIDKSVIGSQREEIRDTLLRMKNNVPPANIEVIVNTTVNKDGTTETKTQTRDKSTGKTSTPTMRKGIDPVLRGSNLRYGGF